MEGSAILSIILIVLSAAVLLFAGFSIPFLLQIWRTAKGMSQTLDLLNESLPAIMKNLEEITTRINQTSGTVHYQVESIALAINRMRGMVALLVGAEEVLRRSLHLSFPQALRTSLAMARGLRVFIGHLLGPPREDRDPRRTR
jgi:hypothetical protein